MSGPYEPKGFGISPTRTSPYQPRPAFELKTSLARNDLAGRIIKKQTKAMKDLGIYPYQRGSR